MYDLVGDKIHEIFDAQVVDIGLYDAVAGRISYPYTIERGVRFPDEGSEITGFGKVVLETREPMLVNDVETYNREHGLAHTPIQGEPSKSVLFAPLIVGDSVIGRISLQNFDRTDAFTEADVRLLTTLASSLSVALENARLFDETQRLLKETNERAAELAIINSVQQGLAAKLDMQSMYDLVGDKLAEIFDAQVIDISTYDLARRVVSSPYVLERGVRLHAETGPFGPWSAQVADTREAFLINDVEDWERETGIQSVVAVGEPSRSVAFAPLLVGAEARGHISIQNLDRTDAFSEADVRLLTTLASSLSVALENARLFDETQRLLTETNERAAELAVINSVQQGLAEQLDMQAMYELVVNKLHEIFDPQASVAIGLYDLENETTEFPYAIERGVRLEMSPAPFGPLTREVIRRITPVVIDDFDVWAAENLDRKAQTVGETPKSVVHAPLLRRGKPFGRISLSNMDRTHAFGESDVRLIATLASSLSVALENARLVAETRQRAAELATINEIGQATASLLDLDQLIGLAGDQMAATFKADIAYVALYDPATRLIEFPYHIENGLHEQQTPIPLGEGLTSQIIQSRQPLLLNRSTHWTEMSKTGRRD